MTTTWTPTAHLRIGDAEREPAVEMLKDAYSVGRLSEEEFDTRLQIALGARTQADLDTALVGLVAVRPQHLHPQPAPAPASPAPLGVRPPDTEERLLAALAHATAIVPILVGPLVLRHTVGKRSPYVRHHASQAFNLQLTLLLITIVTFGIGGFVYAVAWAIGLVGAVVALTGDAFRYPFTLRLLS